VSSYRFCRSDDVPLLVQAYNACYRVHFPALGELTVDGFKRWIRRLDLWTSSCMVAFAGHAPIAVLLAAKRETQSLIFRIGVAPGHQRKGHATHLLDSLSRKLAILGPPRFVAEVAEELAGARAFVERCGYEPECVYVDFDHPGGATAPRAAELIFPVTVDELVANDALERRSIQSWRRAPETLVASGESLRGLALATDARIEAWLLYEPSDRGPHDVRAFRCADPARRERWLRPLFQQLAASERPLRLSRIERGEIPFELLESWGFRPSRRTIGYTALARETTP